MANETPQPSADILNYRPRDSRAPMRFAMSNSMTAKFNPIGSPSNDDPEKKLRLIRIHLDMAKEIFKSKGITFGPAEEGIIIAALAGAPAESSEIFRIVDSEASSISKNLVKQNEIKAFMESNGISHNEINHFARIGAKDLVGMLAAMQRFKSSGYASVSEWVAATGNMSGSMPSVYYSGGQSYYTGDTSSSTISMGNYTKAGSAFFATGMTFTTFNNLRNDRANFSGTNILHAGEDIGKHELDVNDPRIARNFAIMDKYDNARRPERNRLFKDLAKRTQDDEEMSRLKKAYDAAGTDAEKSAIAAQIQEHGRIIQQQNGTAAHIKTAPQESREATQQSADDIVAKSLGIQAQHRAQMGLAPVASVNNRSLAAVNKSFAENGIVTQRSISADNVITTGVATKDADFSAQLLALGTQPQIKTGEADQLGNSDKKVASAEPPQAIPAIKAETSAARPVVHDKKSEAATLSAIPAVSTEKKPPAQVVKNTTASPSVGV